jgi:asparagine synthase (glutamine-hydrolysing)
MCGITGFLDFNCHSSEFVLRSMTDVLHHRGPDDSGYYLDRHVNAHVGIGHRRLSILDLSPHGHQPMFFNNIVISYNGEIYNFKEIREELKQKDYDFESNSDTEVILKAYHYWGTKMLGKFNGMFSFALYDKNQNKLLLFRDRAGVKPLYWYFKNGLFLFSSELKTFHQHPGFQKELNSDGLALFLQYGYIPQPHTIFNHCFKLKGGHYLVVDLLNKNIFDTKYWDVIDCYKETKLKISQEEAIDETEKLLKSAFEYRMISDVPVGIFLSGGYDSSIVTAMLQANHTEKLKTFTIGFHEEKYNEAKYAKNIADYLGTDHTEYYCTQQDALDIMPLLPEIWDEPFGDSSVIPTILVSKLARKQVTVSLSADGGDEIFGGYSKYTSICKMRNLLNIIHPVTYSFFKNLLNSHNIVSVFRKFGLYNIENRLKRISCMVGCNESELLSLFSSTSTISELGSILNIPFNRVSTDFSEHFNSTLIDNLLSIDYKTFQIDDVLTKVDRATMSVGLEGREPLLDYRIIEFVAKLDPSLKINNGNKKYLLKQIAYRYIPKDLLDRPKKGFSFPIYEWFRGKLRDYLLYYLDGEKLRNEGIFNVNTVINYRDSYLSGEKISMTRLWYILMFEMWKEKWF